MLINDDICASVGLFEYPDGRFYEGIQITNKTVLGFIKQRFDKDCTTKASNWAIDNIERGTGYTTSGLLKLLCKFQRDCEPTINYNFVLNEFIAYQENNKEQKCQNK